MLYTRNASRLLLAACAVLLAACGDQIPDKAAEGGSMAEQSQVSGEVIYRERMLLPPGAEVEVHLEDISRADALATVLASVRFPAENGPPFPFVIEYDPARIDARMRYAIRATIRREDQLIFTTTEYIDPFAAQPLEVMVYRVAEPVKAETVALEGPRWELQTLDAEPAAKGAGGKPVDLQFFADEQRAGGFSGCNRYFGGYSREGASMNGSALKFGAIAGTLMACPEGEELERAYHQMLGRVDAFRLTDEGLALLAGGEVVATFRARD
jgi:putative lipoprotein